ncbi:MAG: acetylglutamate kinase, partial [Eggerthellaceae bacterium]|nr:acetylglutamate kinase [Eggerthellaceae bacterium]
AHKVFFLTDVDGLYEDYPDRSTLISSMTAEEARAMIEEGAVATGMIPKLRSCVYALDAGVKKGHIINGTTPHALLLEILTNNGIGTMVTGDAPAEAFAAPLGNFAAKLIENRA